MAGIPPNDYVAPDPDVQALAPVKWFARCHDEACGPLMLQARSKPLAISKGAVGDYIVRDPIRHLNGLQVSFQSGSTEH